MICSLSQAATGRPGGRCGTSQPQTSCYFLRSACATESPQPTINSRLYHTSNPVSLEHFPRQTSWQILLVISLLTLQDLVMTFAAHKALA